MKNQKKKKHSRLRNKVVGYGKLISLVKLDLDLNLMDPGL